MKARTKPEMVRCRPIRTREDFERALQRVGDLMNHPDAEREGTPSADELDVLSALVEAYDQRHFPMPDPDPIEAIKFRMEQQGLTPRDLEPILGSRARVWEILHRKRDLTLAMIRALHRQLGIPAESLLGT